MKQLIELNREWHFRKAGTKDWLAARVPGNVHCDLLRNQKIDPPYFGLNERSLQWIDKAGWEYRTTFTVHPEQAASRHQILIFEGLDTIAEVWVNDARVLTTDNMFRRYEADVANHLKTGDNHLIVRFGSPTLTALERQKAYGLRLPAVNDQSNIGEMGRNQVSPFIRKAPYHFGWDWGPRLVTTGIWRPVRLRFADDATIEDFFIKQLEVGHQWANLEARVTLAGIEPGRSGDYRLKIVAPERGQQWVMPKVETDAEGVSRLDLIIEGPDLWYPNGYGPQALTRFRAELFRNNEPADTREVRTGLRRVELVREPDSEGRSFYFRINDIPIFAKGANYIPNDIFPTEVDSAKYRRILQSAVDANMNMLRVWGGGIYENDHFYDLCDELGLMVWQDFMFACSMYPGAEAFLENVKQEAVDNIKRLRNHPCLVLWCGNNEIDTAWAPHSTLGGWGWKQKYTPGQRKRIWQAYDTLFHHLLPDMVTTHDGTRAYWPSSPLADWGETADYATTSGDMHYWGVWHNDEPFENYGKVKSRFMSEYGFQSFPALGTVYRYTRPEDRAINSAVMQSHQRCSFGNGKILQYLSAYLPGARTLEEILYAGQFLQAYGVERAIELHRMRKPYTMGTLYWQLNDCWPVASWSSMDYYGHWKGLHYRAREAFKPVKILASVAEGEADAVDLWLTSDQKEPMTGELHLSWLDFNGRGLWEEIIPVTSDFDQTLHVYRFEMRNEDPSIFRRSLLMGRFSSEENLVDRKLVWFDIPKKLDLPKAEITSQVLEAAGRIVIQLASPVAAMGVALDFKDLSLHLSDNYFDMPAGEVKKIEVLTSEVSIEDIKRRLTIYCVNQLDGGVARLPLSTTLPALLKQTALKWLRRLQRI